MSFVLDRVDPDRLEQVAGHVRQLSDVSLPSIPILNMAPCADHEVLGTPQSWCRRCGLASRRHQRVAGTWLYFRRKGLLADPCGSGKTASATIALAMAAQSGELDPRRGGGRAIVVCRPPAATQWADELRRFVPSLRTAVASGPVAARSEIYAAPWDVVIIGYQMLIRDIEIIKRLGIKHVIVDDVDPCRHETTETAWCVKQLALEAQRVIILSATPLQKKLDEMYDLLSLVGARKVFGPKTLFLRRYTEQRKNTVYLKGKTKGKQNKRTVNETVGYKRLGEFKSIIAPYTLRRPVSALDDVDMPAVESHNVMLDLYPAQRERYIDLQNDVLRIVRGGASTVKRLAAGAKLVYASQITEGLAALDEEDSNNSSIKYDWVVERIEGDWSGDEFEEPEKVVVFVQFKAGVRALQSRLASRGIGQVTVWGEERDPVARGAALKRFWEDPSCRVLIGTSAIEQSLNLQVARHLVNVDQLPNPARMTQLAGRVRRDGSRFATVYVHNLIATDTHEERILAMLEHEAALAGAVWDEADPIYSPLSPLEMMQLISPDSAPVAAA